MNWQPIDTAPKDGTMILVWTGKKVFSAFYKEFTGFFTGPQKGWFTEYNREFGEPTAEVFPSHWMTLPKPPQT